MKIGYKLCLSQPYVDWIVPERQQLSWAGRIHVETGVWNYVTWQFIVEDICGGTAAVALRTRVIIRGGTLWWRGNMTWHFRHLTTTLGFSHTQTHMATQRTKMLEHHPTTLCGINSQNTHYFQRLKISGCWNFFIEWY